MQLTLGVKRRTFPPFGYVQLLNNVSNNWITETTQELEFYVDGEFKNFFDGLTWNIYTDLSLSKS